ncbi:MAG: hypothetical protein WCA98_13625 [Candidatus Acidiferrales bacterium]
MNNVIYRHLNRRQFAALGGLSALFLFCAALAAWPADTEHVRLEPHFSPGQVLRYQIDMHNVTKGRTTSPVEDPEAASQLAQTTTVIVRLDVLRADASAPGDSRKIGIRATYERSNVTNESDAYDEQAEALAEQYRKLEGQSLEFTIDADGRVSNLTGLDKVMQDPSAIASVRSWMSNLSRGAGFPKKGIAIGEKWHYEEPLPGAPLRGTVWRTESTYVRNEPCRAAEGAAAESTPASRAGAPNSEMCAIILTQFKILQSNPKGDLTPPDYIQNGLRTSGSWIGSGDSLNSISLRTGLIVSVTQTSDQQMNFTISSNSSPSKLNYTGEVKSQSQITLLPETPAH